MGKKSQITSFIVIGIILLVAFGTMMFIRSKMSEEKLAPEAYTPTLYDAQPVKIFVESCLYNVLTQGIAHYGLKQNNISTYLEKVKEYCNSHIDGCVELSVFEKEGYKFEQGKKYITVNVADDKNTVYSKLNFSLTVAKGDFVKHFEEFSARYKFGTPITKGEDSAAQSKQETEQKKKSSVWGSFHKSMQQDTTTIIKKEEAKPEEEPSLPEETPAEESTPEEPEIPPEEYPAEEIEPPTEPVTESGFARISEEKYFSLWWLLILLLILILAEAYHYYKKHCKNKKLMPDIKPFNIIPMLRQEEKKPEPFKTKTTSMKEEIAKARRDREKLIGKFG